jgi:hypothetical protein
VIAQAVPKTKAEELSDKINSYALTKRKISKDDFNFRLLKNEIKGLFGKINHADYYDLLGRVSCLENNKNSVIESYKNAIKHAPNSFNIYENYVVSLKNLGLINHAFEQSKILIKKFPTHPNALSFFIGAASVLCHFRESYQLLNNVNISVNNINFLEKVIHIFDSAELTDDEAQRLCELAYSILETKNLYYSGSAIEIIEDCVFYSIYIDVSIEEAARIDFELSYLFAEKLENMRDDVIVFEYKSVETLKL